MEYLYNEGDRVVLLDGDAIEEDVLYCGRGTVGWNGMMSDLIGNVGTICELGTHHGRPTYHIKFGDESTWWAEQEWIEPHSKPIFCADTKEVDAFLDEFSEG